MGSKPKVDVKINPQDVEVLQPNEVNDQGEYDSDDEFEAFRFRQNRNRMHNKKGSGRVVMSDEDKNICNEFRKTMKMDIIEILELQRIKENVSRKEVYDA